MSVKVHEAFSLDSFQDRLLFFDDFHGDQLQDEWDTTVVVGGTVAVVDAQTGGIVRLTAPTNATGDSAQIDWNDIRSLHVDQKVTIEFRAKMSDETNNTSILALHKGSADQIMFYYNAGGVATTWTIWCEDDNTITNPSSGVTGDTDWHIYRIECFPTGEVHFYIDGVETGNSPITTNIPADADDYLQARVFFDTNNTDSKTLDVDYVYIRQER